MEDKLYGINLKNEERNNNNFNNNSVKLKSDYNGNYNSNSNKFQMISSANTNNNYEEIINKTQSVNEENFETKFKEGMALSEATMPGLFISTMNQRDKPISEDELYDCVFPRLNSLRKPDGCKYKLNNLKKSIKSTLCSSGIFQKVDEVKKLWFYKNEEALHYLKRTAEKTMSRKKDKIIKKEIEIEIENKDTEEKKNVLIINPKLFLNKSLGDSNLKYLKANNILNELLMKYKKNKDIKKKLKSPFTNCLSTLDLIKKVHGDEIKQMLKIISTNRNDQPDIVKLTSTIGGLENKIEMFHQLFKKLNPNDFTIKDEVNNILQMNNN